MLKLPIDDVLPQVLEALRTQASLVLVASPGAGKTTRVPPGIVGAGILAASKPNLIMLQPRRVAARASAERIAYEQSWRLGEEVGYHIRFEKRYGANTRIRILTEAILTRMLLDDPGLENDGIGCVILDEFHERNLHSDVALAFLREVQQTIRPDLKIVVMSATLDAGPVAAFLGGAPVIVSEGRLFPVDITYLSQRDRPLETRVAAALEEVADQPGDVLVFLPGVAEIDRARRALTPLERAGAVVHPLHGRLESDEQQQALRPDARGRRKVILATNIAETSLTIDGVRTVVDSGLVRVASFDPDRGMDRLDLERISAASAAQRAGRAGRQAPGRAVRLWSEAEQKNLAAYALPEVERVDLASALLAVHAWGARDARAFGWFAPPPEDRLAAAEELLTMLGALKNGVLTDGGKAMLRVPAHPRVARLLLGAAGTPLAEDAVSLAAILADESRNDSASPLAMLHRLPAHLARVRDQFANIIRSLPKSHDRVTDLAELLLLSFPDRVARRRGSDAYAALLADGSGARLAPEALTPGIASAALFLALDLHHDTRSRKGEAVVRAAVPLTEESLVRLFPDDLRTLTALEYDSAKEKVTAFTRRLFRNMLLHEDPHGKVDLTESGKVLGGALADRASELFRAEESCGKLLARIALLRHHMPEHPWPTLDDAHLRDLLLEAAAGKRSLVELQVNHALANMLRATLVYPLDRLLDQHAPETIEVPSGSRIKLDYTLPTPGAAPTAPILAVRLQELFGWTETPRIAGNRVPVLLHLLSPGFKPMQITSDLKSFWASAYFEVRKDLRVRYPKHKWPEDPLSATPEAKGRRR